MHRAFALLLSLLLAVAPVAGARATQHELVPPTAGVYTGVQFSQLLGDAFRSLASCNKGPTAPANVDSAAVDGLCWIDDSVSPWLKKRYVDGAWVVEGALDNANGLFVGVIGGGTATVASASTTDLASVPQANITISGNATINLFGSAAPQGVVKIIRFAGALTLTHSASLKVPGGYSLTTAADDRAIVTHLGSGAWEVTQYTRASGVPIDVSRVAALQHGAFASAPALHVLGYGQAISRASYPAYLAAVTRGQNGTRTSSSRVITGLTSTAGFGAGMPVEGTGIPSGATISSVDSTTQITLDAGHAASTSGTATVTVFLTGYGSGGDSTTVGVQNCAGVLVAGRDDASGSARGTITNAGSGIASTAINSFGGAQSVLVLQGHFPSAATFTVNIPSGQGSHTHTLSMNNAAANTTNPGDTSLAQGTFYRGGTANSPLSASMITTDTLPVMSGTAATGGSDTPLNKMPPTLIADCAVRVTP